MSKPRPTKRKSPAPQAECREQQQELLLERIQVAGQECRTVEREFGVNPPPDLEMLIKLHRALVFDLANKDLANPKVLSAITQLTKRVLEHAQLEERRRQREFTERKYHDQREAEAAERTEREKSADGQDAITPNTTAKIERELKLF